ncbi:serine/threonine protein kinase [Streptomyces sp. NBC_00654]|uniref:serine/threonine protein kinase n=1 Tax=Streptomyces sp. NBC_00654 TaxID=2975799 RepID=UPI0022589B92|nr:serine/threonine-protein kinase [Streptomyces sp. NBC_00654]MCX4968910.1 serine/threonine protein kinase [Streptomyces sp. NBC_00654]
MTTVKNMVLGRYELMDMVGSGGQGELFAGWDLGTDRKVAIKLQKPREFESTRHYGEIAQELAVEGGRTKHLAGIEGIPGFLASGHYQNRYCIVLEFVDGAALYDTMISARPLKVSTAAAVIGQLCEILHQVHTRRLVHRDVKPENIILEPDGRVRLIDMGLAIEIGEPTERGCGTVGYAPPEQFDENPDGVTPRADVFALGCLLLEMTVMRLPYAGMAERPEPDCPVLPPDRLRLVPEQIRSLALRMVDREPANRPADVLEVFRLLRPLLLPPGSKPPGKPLDPDPTEFYRTGRSALWPLGDPVR